MKKILLASTAVAALAAFSQPATAAEPMTVTLGGYVDIQFGIWDNDANNETNREFRNDTEVYINARATADNGISYGVDIDIDSADGNNSSAGFDEAHLFISGNFGTLELGDEDGAADALAVYAPGAVASGVLDGDYDQFLGNVPPNQGGGPFKAGDSSDSTKITYYTPVFSGFQAGISYAPESGDAGEMDNVVINTQTGSTDFVEFGANYQGEFSGVGVALGFGLSRFDNAGQDFLAWHVGAQFSYAGFTFGGGYVDQDEAGGIDDGWNIGAQYDFGPVGVGIQYAQTDSVATNNDTTEAVGGGLEYAIAPGLTAYTEVIWYDDETTNDDGFLWMLGTTVSF